jgi:hypothetical protein
MDETLGLIALVLLLALVPVAAKIGAHFDRKSRSKPDYLPSDRLDAETPRVVERQKSLGEPQQHPIQSASYSDAAKEIADRLIARHPIQKRETVVGPADDAGLRALIQSYARQAIVFPRRLPLDLSSQSLSFFGGSPIVPAGWTWPRGRQSGLPLVFMAQIDISTIPPGEVRSTLPADGVLYFFSAGAGEEGAERKDDVNNAVLYAPGPTTGWQTATVPADMPPNPVDRMRWGKAGKGAFVPFTKWHVTPTAMMMYPSDSRWAEIRRNVSFDFSEWDQGRPSSNDEAWDQISGELSSAEWTRVFGAKASSGAVNPVSDANAVPPIWLGVRVYCSGILTLMAQKQPEPELGPASLDRFARAQSTAATLLSRAEAESPTNRVPPDVITAFAALRSEIADIAKATATVPGSVKTDFRDRHVELLSPYRVRDVQTLCIDRTIEACLSHSAETAALINPDQVEQVRGRVGHRAHWMGGFPSNIQGEAREIFESNALFMEFGDDPGVGWGWGGSIAFQYWIGTAQLKSRNFDAAFMTVDST